MTAITADLPTLSLTFVGWGPNPIAVCIGDQRPSTARWTLPSLSLVERAVLRALCNEALATLDRTEADLAKEDS